MEKSTILIKCRGTQAHGSVCSWVGDNAIVKLVGVLDKLPASEFGCGIATLSSGERSSASSEYCEARLNCSAGAIEKIEAFIASLNLNGVDVVREN